MHWNRDRWFVLAILFLLVNTYGVVRLTAPSRPPPLAVSLDAGADGLVKDRASLTLRFASDMVPAAATRAWTPTGPAVFSPATPGRYCWTSPRDLIFEPSEPWRLCTPYAVALKSDCRDLEGRCPVMPASASFATAALDLIEAHQIDATDDRRVTLQLRFTGAPAAGTLADHLALTSESGITIPFRITGGVQTPVVLLRTDPLPQDAFTLVLRAGLASNDGPLGLPDDRALAFTLMRKLALTELTPDMSAFGDIRITARFSVPVDAAAAGNFITVTPPLEVVVDRANSWNDAMIAISGDFKPGQRYAVTLRAGLPAANGEGLAADLTRQVYLPDRPAGVGLRSPGTYLSSRGQLLLPVMSMNVSALTISAERIYPNNLVYYAMRESGNYGGDYTRWSSDCQDGISHVTGEQKIDLPGRPNAAAETAISLRQLMGGHAAGAYVVSVGGERCETVRQLVVVTDVGLAVKRSESDLLVWANSLRTLAPVTGAVVRAYSAANQEVARGVTDEDGLVWLPADFAEEARKPFLVTVESGDDHSYLKLQDTAVTPGAQAGGDPYLVRGCEAYVYADRGIYRPGETAHVRAVVRDGSMKLAGTFPVELRITGPDGRVFRNMAGTLDALSCAEFIVEWPAYAATGRYRAELRVPGAEAGMGRLDVSVEEFVPPQLAVSVELPDARISEKARLIVRARHLFGRPAAGHPAQAAVSFQHEEFVHAAWPGFVFADRERTFTPADLPIGKSRLDDEGRATFDLAVPPAWRPPSALRAVFSATVTESSGRATTAFATRQVDVYPFYVGARLAREGSLLRVGEPAVVALAAVFPDGAAVTNAAALRVVLSRLSWSTVLNRRADGSYVYESKRHETPAWSGEVALTNGVGEVPITPRSTGSFLLTATSAEAGSVASLSFYATEDSNPWTAWSQERPDVVQLDFDKEHYCTGEVARLLIRAPFAGKGLLTIERDRVLETRVLTLTNNTASAEIPVTPGFAPNVYCAFTLLRPASPIALDGGTNGVEQWGSHRAVGQTPLRVVSPDARLVVQVDAQAHMRPQAPLTINVRVVDAAGQPCAAALTVAAVDEGICMLTEFKTPDPLNFFMRKRALGVQGFDLYSLLMPDYEDRLGRVSSPGGDEAEGLRRRLNPMPARRFKPVALWTSTAATGPDGRATVTLPVPEFTGQLRVMVVAVDAQRFGSAEAAVAVKRPLVVISSLPRFLAPGDRCDLPIRVFNETGSDCDVSVGVGSSGPVVVAPPSAHAAIPNGREGAFAMALEARAVPGVASVNVLAEAGEERYEEAFELSIRPASPLITRSDFGVVRPGESRTLALPTDWLPGTEAQTVWCSGMPSLTLGAGLDYLMQYPHGCLEQTTSGAFPLLYMADLAHALRPGSLEAGETGHYVRAAILRILSMQRADGGFNYWPESTEVYRWGSIYATHFLVEAAAAGHEMPVELRDAALAALERRLDAPAPDLARDAAASAWHEDLRDRAYICYVLARAGRPAHGWTSRLLELLPELSGTARTHLAGALAEAGNRREARALLENIGIADAEATAREAGGGLESGVRSLALLLATWVDLDPGAPEVALLAERLDAKRVRGTWYTTQENAMALLALGKYSRALQQTATTFTGRISWQAPGGEHATALTNGASRRFEIPATDRPQVTISNAGPGVAYYYWRSSGVAMTGTVADIDQQLRVRRELLDVDGGAIEGDSVEQGDLVVVKVTVDTMDETLENLAIEDLLPAGLEVENTNLKTSQQVPWVQRENQIPLQHLDVRDDRVVAFVGAFRGTASLYYVARAVTPGTFSYPPIAVECMYDPSVRSIHGGGRTLRVTGAATGAP